MKKLKIGILTEIINYHSGARAPIELAKHLAKRGHEISVYSYDFGVDGSAKFDLKAQSVRVLTFKKRYPSLIGRCIAAASLFKNLRKDNPDVIIFAGTLPFFLAARLTGIPIIWMYMGTQFDALLEDTIPNQNISLIVKILNKMANIYIYIVGLILCRFSTGVVAISRYAAKETQRLYKRTVDETIYLGTTYFQNTIITKLEKKTDTIFLLTVSRITPYKGFHLILEAVKKVKTKKNILLTIAGSQAKHHYVEYLKKVGGDNVKIVLDPSDLDLAKLYQEADFCVTADRFLYFGLSIYEAAFFGKPTISLNNAAASEIIDHGKTGLIAKTPEELGLYIKNLSENPLLRKKLGISARKKGLQFTWERCAFEWEKELLKYAKQPLQ